MTMFHDQHLHRQGIDCCGRLFAQRAAALPLVCGLAEVRRPAPPPFMTDEPAKTQNTRPAPATGEFRS